MSGACRCGARGRPNGTHGGFHHHHFDAKEALLETALKSVSQVAKCPGSRQKRDNSDGRNRGCRVTPRVGTPRDRGLRSQSRASRMREVRRLTRDGHQQKCTTIWNLDGIAGGGGRCPQIIARSLSRHRLVTPMGPSPTCAESYPPYRQINALAKKLALHFWCGVKIKRCVRELASVAGRGAFALAGRYRDD
ncbi:hypothetical protein SAMN05443247_09661 [Bradyrhizobium erythrophlei]|nr:hypothetical protein SAMN05443247_09661 [Bradyrhizobium erythrophlei]